MTLDDPERTAITQSIAQNIWVLEPTTKIWMKLDPHHGDEDVAQWL